MIRTVSNCVLAILSIAGFGLVQPNESSLSPASLHCEYLVNPGVVDTREPRLSWVSDSSVRGAGQTAYQVLVSSTPEGLVANRGDLWDTDKVASDETIQILYRGKPLRSRQQCYWKVRVWDQAGKASVWSRPAQWAMGLLDQSDWSAKWIGDKSPSV